MQLKTLLVCLTTPDHAETLMKFAVPLARKHGAHLVGLHTVEALVVHPGIAMHIPHATFASFNESQRATSEEIKTIFARHTDPEDFQSEYRLVLAESVSASERIVESARAADLVVMSHEDRETDRYDQRNLQTQVIRDCGRPVIVVPLGYDGPEIGANILLGWSDTREAARAAHDMLSVADKGAEVTVLRAGHGASDSLRDSDAIDLVETLARHDLRATLEHREIVSDSVADVLNQVAFEKGADLIVTGALGHSKVYDFVIGATTHALLRDAKLPVLFSK